MGWIHSFKTKNFRKKNTKLYTCIIERLFKFKISERERTQTLILTTDCDQY